ncbi:MAG: hypothetical protein ABI406_00775 [Ktedonobacteraceae bacterium]
MEYLLSFGPYDNDYEESPTPEDDDGEDKVAPEDPDPEDDPSASGRGWKGGSMQKYARRFACFLPSFYLAVASTACSRTAK